MNRSPLQERIEAIKIITELFKPERIIYIIVSCISFLILCVSFVLLYITKDDKSEIVILMFGSGGMASISIGGFLHMWNRAIKIISQGGIKVD